MILLKIGVFRRFRRGRRRRGGVNGDFPLDSENIAQKKLACKKSALQLKNKGLGAPPPPPEKTNQTPPLLKNSKLKSRLHEFFTVQRTFPSVQQTYENNFASPDPFILAPEHRKKETRTTLLYSVQCTYNTMWKCMQDFFQRRIKVFYHITNNFTFVKVINYYKYYKSNENYVYIQP